MSLRVSKALSSHPKHYVSQERLQMVASNQGMFLPPEIICWQIRQELQEAFGNQIKSVDLLGGNLEIADGVGDAESERIGSVSSASSEHILPWMLQPVCLQALKSP